MLTSATTNPEYTHFKIDIVSKLSAELFEDIVLQNPAGCYFARGLYQLRGMLISFFPDSSSKLRPERTWSHWLSGRKCHHKPGGHSRVASGSLPTDLARQVASGPMPTDLARRIASGPMPTGLAEMFFSTY